MSGSFLHLYGYARDRSGCHELVNWLQVRQMQCALESGVREIDVKLEKRFCSLSGGNVEITDIFHERKKIRPQFLIGNALQHDRATSFCFYLLIIT